MTEASESEEVHDLRGKLMTAKMTIKLAFRLLKLADLASSDEERKYFTKGAMDALGAREK